VLRRNHGSRRRLALAAERDGLPAAAALAGSAFHYATAGGSVRSFTPLALATLAFLGATLVLMQNSGRWKTFRGARWR